MGMLGLNMGERKYVSLDNGNTYHSVDELTNEQIDKYWELLVPAMDKDVRETINTANAPCLQRQFLTYYLDAASEDLIIG